MPELPLSTIADIPTIRQYPRVRTAILLWLLAVFAGCSEPEARQTVERIELRLSGAVALDVQVGSKGHGGWRLHDPDANERTGEFRVTAEEFVALSKRLSAYRQHARPMTDESVGDMINGTCAAEENHLTDRGGFWIRWVGPGVNEHYGVDFGCDPARHSQRNGDLIGIIQSLPVPRGDF